MTDTERKDIDIGQIRRVVEQLKRQSVLTKEVKFWKLPIKNWDLFNEMKESGRLRQMRPGGPWELCD